MSGAIWVLGGRLRSLARMRKSALAGGSAGSMRTSLMRATGGASARSPVTNCSTAAAGPARWMSTPSPLLATVPRTPRRRANR